MNGLTASNLLLIVFCTLTEVSRELCFKQGANGLSVKLALRSRFVWLGILLWAIELVAWLHVLETMPLTIAFPLMSMVYVITFLGGATLMREPLSSRHTLGALCVTAGVAFIGSSGV